MRNKIRLAIVLVLIVLASILYYRRTDSSLMVAVKSDETKTTSKIINTFKSQKPISLIKLPVPYISEAPEGNWSGDWVNACEEASISMVAKFYAGDKSVSVQNAKMTLQKLFDIEYKIYGNSRNTDALQMIRLITDYSTFEAVIKPNPTIDEIKDEIIAGHPVISLHRGFDLKNPNIPFSPAKSSYHTIVVVGFDDASKEFITHDPGDDKDGVNHRYSYTDFMFSLHDYNKVTDKTDGVPTVLFTKAK